MSEDGPDSLVLDLLRHLRSCAEERLGLLVGSVAWLSRHLDRLADDIDRVKRRLELSGVPT